MEHVNDENLEWSAFVLSLTSLLGLVVGCRAGGSTGQLLK